MTDDPYAFRYTREILLLMSMQAASNSVFSCKANPIHIPLIALRHPYLILLGARPSSSILLKSIGDSWAAKGPLYGT